MSDAFGELDKDMFGGLGDAGNDPFALSQTDTTVLDAVFGADSDSDDDNNNAATNNANNINDNVVDDDNDDADDAHGDDGNVNGTAADDVKGTDANDDVDGDDKADLPNVPAKKRELTFLDIAEPSYPRLDPSRELLLFDVPGQVSLESQPYSGRGHPIDAQGADAVMRWRVAADGSRESNARLVRWQDGSMDLMIGNEILVGKLSDVTDGLCYQYVRQGRPGSTLLEAHARLTRRLGVVPRTAGGAVPVRVARAVTARHTEQKKSEIKIFTAHQDPERDKRDKELIEEQRIQLRNRQLGIKCARAV